MATKTFKSTKDLLRYVKSVGVRVLQDVIDKEVVPAMMEQIERVVYDAYEPREYRRRKNNFGLGDIRNIYKEYSNDGLSIKIKNIAQPSHDTRYATLDVIIVEGTEYWKSFEKYQPLPFPRDFYKATREVIEKELPYIVKDAFKKRGVNVTVKNINIERR